MHQVEFWFVVYELIKETRAPVHETRYGLVKVKKGVKVKSVTGQFDEDDGEKQEWFGEYLIFAFGICALCESESKTGGKNDSGYVESAFRYGYIYTVDISI